jgi:hypothetical protein
VLFSGARLLVAGAAGGGSSGVARWGVVWCGVGWAFILYCIYETHSHFI